MALIAPVAFAAAGGLLSGGATWGMAAGWLIGSWLFNKNEDPKNQVFDPGAEEMPSFNQALRGATMPILFGSNRVSSNIVWTNNFTTIRNESQSSGGGGKGGGSGMGSKGGQPSSGEVTYEYKWDIMFHIGMSDQNLDLIGAWAGTERINSNTIVAILGNSASQWGTYTGITGQDGIDLNFEDSYFHGAAATGADIDPWSHYQTVTGGPYRFPYTVYVGFKQLELGNTARIPQISWEIGEGGVGLTATGASTAFLNYDYNSFQKTQQGVTGRMFTARDGSTWVIKSAPADSNSAVVTNIDTNSDVTFWNNDTEKYDLLKTYLYGATTPSTYDIGNRIQPINGKYFLYTRATLEPGTSNYAVDGLLIEMVDSAGTWEVVGGFAYDAGPSITQYTRYATGRQVGWVGEGTDDDFLMFINSKTDQGWDSYPTLTSYLPINHMKDFPYDFSTFYWDTKSEFIYTTATDIDNNFFEESGFNVSVDYNSGGTTSNAFVSLPTVEIGILGLTWDTKIWCHVNGEIAQWHLVNTTNAYRSTFIQSLAPTYPKGFMVEFNSFVIDKDTGEITDDGLESYTIHENSARAPHWPPSDELVDEGGLDTSSQTNWSFTPTVQQLRTGFGAGGTLFLYTKRTQSSSDESLIGNNIFGKAKVCIWNPLAESFTEYATVYGPIADSKSDWNQNDSRYVGTNYDYVAPRGFYNSSNNKFYIHMGDTADQGSNTDSNHVGELGNLSISGGTDIPPPEIIYRILTSTVYGLGISTSDIDTDSYTAAVLYCENEDIKVSCQYRREEGALQIITQLLELYGGYLIDSGGKIKFGLQEFATSTVRTIDNDHLRVDQDGEPPVLITKGARQDTYNRVKVNYFDRTLSYRQNFVEVADEVDMDINGVRAQEFPAKFVMSEATARKMAVRALWGNMYARDIYDFKLGAKDADLEPGDVITLVDSFHTELQSGVQARIVTWQETEPLTFQVKAVEEVEYISTATLAADSVTEATSNSLFKRPQPMAEFGMYELPAEFQGADSHVYVGYRQQSDIMGARLYLSTDGVTYGLVDEQMPYIVSGILANGLPLRGPGYVEEGVEVYLMPDQITSGAFNTSSPLYAQNHALDNVDASGRALGTGNIWINSEMMAYEGVNLLAQNHYRFDKLYRGWGGTHLQAHNSGDTWWRHGGGVFADVINVDKIGTLIYYKVTGFNFAGQEYNVASVDARTYQVQGTFWRPQVQAPIATYVQSPGSFLTIQSEDLGYISKKQVIAGGSTVRFEWPQAAQEAGYGAQGYNTGLYGRFTQDTASVNYMIQVLSSDYSTVVRCLTVDTTAYEYTHLVNSEDWNGWTGNFAVRVTPFNPYGTALRSRTKILELFE